MMSSMLKGLTASIGMDQAAYRKAAVDAARSSLRETREASHPGLPGKNRITVQMSKLLCPVILFFSWEAGFTTYYTLNRKRITSPSWPT